MRAFACLVVATVVLAWVAGCAVQAPTPISCTTHRHSPLSNVVSVDTVDLLLMIDNSSGMTEHQVQLRDQIPRLITTLITGIRDPARGRYFTPPRSLHIGIVSSTMGLGPLTDVPGCPPGFGDDGILFTRSPFPQPGCPAFDLRAMYPHGVFEFNQGMAMPTAAQFRADVACVAVLGTGGCGLEFELEPILKALAPAPDATGASSVSWTAPGYQPPTFYGNTNGHGSDSATNGGFLRPNSVLAIVTLNDEDDCSTQDFAIFGHGPMFDAVSLNTRCVAFGDHLYPITRYVDGLIGLRRDARLLVLSEITGIPNDLSPARTAADLTRIIADRRMQPTIDPARPTSLIPVCRDTRGTQTAAPALRMARVAEGLAQRGASVRVHSICENDLTGAIDDLADQIARGLDAACSIGRPDANGFVDCELFELLPATATHCTGLPHPEAYTFVGTETSAGGTMSLDVCRVRQVGRAGAAMGTTGWAFDDGDPCRASFSAIIPMVGAAFRFECGAGLTATGTSAQLGTLCDPVTGSATFGAMLSCSTGHAAAGNPATLACDPFERWCGVRCASDADCAAAGLANQVCDWRSATDYFGVLPRPAGVAPTDLHHFCVPPTCAPMP